MSRMQVDPSTIRALAALLVETGLTEIEVCERDSRIRVSRAASAAAAAAPAAAVAVVPAAAALPPADLAAHPGAVTSPMVGVAYLAPEPGASPYVAVGQTVAAGQTLLLIEAMKTFNQIKAPKSGTLERIVVGSGAPVEFGEVLMIIE